MRLGRTVCMLTALCGAAWSQTPLTTIQDTLFNADGTRFNGSLTISWSTFDVANVGTVVQQSRIVAVVNGNLLVQLVPNATAAPPANIYTVLYQSSGNQQFAETWTVPVSATPLTVPAVRIAAQSASGAAAGSATAGGASTNPTTIPESDVVGLQADLAQRPIMGISFGNNAVAVVDGNGNLETAVGDPGACVFVDGTTGPCGAPTYSDAETPGGTVDGVNNTLTLANTPLGLSLMLFRNGLYLTPNFDYAISGSTVTFVAGAIPQPGDTLTAYYRVDTSASSDISAFNTGAGSNALHTTAAQVICSAVGSATLGAAWTQLGGCDIPAAGLNPGDRIEVRFGFAHTGTTSGFSFQVNWGSAAILTRTASAQDAAIVGQAEAAIASSGAQVSEQSWGTVLSFLPGISTAPTQQGLEVTFKAALTTAGTDSVSLTNYTVLRYPAN